MTAEIRAFVEAYKAKPLPPVTVEEFFRQHNHEIWRRCPKCGTCEDLRKTDICSNCKTKIKS